NPPIVRALGRLDGRDDLRSARGEQCRPKLSLGAPNHVDRDIQDQRESLGSAVGVFFGQYARLLTRCAFGVPLDIVGFIGQLDSPNPQLVNNVGLHRCLRPLTALPRKVSSLLWIAHAPSPKKAMLGCDANSLGPTARYIFNTALRAWFPFGPGRQ